MSRILFRRLLLTVAAVVLFTAQGIAADHSYGALREETVPSWIKPSPPVQPRDGWDDYVDLSPNFPPIGNQGGQGSCTCWAVGYYYKSHQEWQEHGWEYTDDHRFSPAFIYNQINGGGDNGSYPSDAFKLLCDNGAAPWELMPYTDQNCTNMPSEEAFYYALPYRSQETYYFDLFQSLDGVKAHLLNGNAAVFAFTVYENFDNISNYNNIYCLSEVNGPPRGGHCVTLCGFDDNLVTSDGIGAFRVANSWGSGWGDGGYFWMSYEAMQSSVTCWGTAYYCTDRIDYAPTTLAIFRVDHEDRYALMYNFGVGQQSSPLWSGDFFDFYMGAQTSWSYPAQNLIVDLTDGAEFLNPGVSNGLYLRVNDRRPWNGLDGEVQEFTVVQLEWPSSAPAGDVPVSIPDDGSYAYSNLEITQGNCTPVSGIITGTLDASGSPYYVTGNLTVPPGASLTLEPGVELTFMGQFSLSVEADAVLTASGTESDPIVFKSLISAVGWGGIRFMGSSGDSRLEYCQIRNGKATGEGYDGCGGAVFIYDCDPSVVNCTIEDSRARRGGGIYFENAAPEIASNSIRNNHADECGGGICGIASDGLILSNLIENNDAVQGGGIYLEGGGASFEDNTVTSNTSVAEGGGICLVDGDPEITDNVFDQNHASQGGAAACLGGAVSAQNNTFESNEAGQGGGLYAEGGEVSLVNNSFSGNSANGGGGIFGYQATLDLEGNAIYENDAGNGGGMNFWFAQVQLTANSVQDNHADGFGGGTYLMSSAAELVNNLLGSNEANNGAGIYLLNSSSVQINNTIARNQAGATGGGMYLAANSSAVLMNELVYHNNPQAIYEDETSACQACYSDIEGGWQGEGNFDAWPMLISFTDYHLADWSPCIGAGATDVMIGENPYSAPVEDLDGNSRPDPAGSAPDVGCYEHELGTPTSVNAEPASGLPLTFALQPGVPNPFNPVTVLRYQLPHRARVRLEIYDLSGRRVATLVDGWRDAGYFEAVFDASGLASGVYFARLTADNFSAAEKLLLVK